MGMRLSHRRRTRRSVIPVAREDTMRVKKLWKKGTNKAKKGEQKRAAAVEEEATPPLRLPTVLGKPTTAMQVRRLCTWLGTKGGKLANDAVEVKRVEHGYGLVATTALPEGLELIRVPKSAVLCPRNSHDGCKKSA